MEYLNAFKLGQLKIRLFTLLVFLAATTLPAHAAIFGQ